MFFRKPAKSDSNIHNFNTTELHVLDKPRMNNIIQVSRLFEKKPLVDFLKKSRFPRDVQKMWDKNNKKDISRQPIKVVLDLHPENEKDYYDYYNNDNHYDEYQERNINGLIDDWNLNSEVETNSKPITKTLSESQERKRCSTLKHGLNSSPGLHQQPQTILSENINRRKIPELRCKDCTILKPSMNQMEPKVTSQIKQANDDYFINILKQLIDKLNKKSNQTSEYEKNLQLQKSNEPIILRNKSVDEEVSNNSSSEEWILKLEKIKGNRIIDKLDSSPEKIFVNGKWIRNKIAKNKNNELKPAVNEAMGLDNKKEKLSKNDTAKYNLISPETQIFNNTDDMSKNLSNFQIVSAQDNEDNPTSPTTEADEHFLVSRETIEPLQLTPSTPTTTSKDNFDYTTVSEKNELKLTTKNVENNFLNNKNSNMKQDKSFESTLNDFQTTSNFEENEETTPEPNNTLTTNGFNRILESDVSTNDNFNLMNTNHSEELTNVENPSSTETDKSSLENDCNCNKKVVKNILSSTTISNITEIKTDTYRLPTKTKAKSHKRSDKPLQETVNKYKNNQSKTIFKEPKLNVFQKDKFVIGDNQSQITRANNRDPLSTRVSKKNPLSKGGFSNLQFVEPKLKNQKPNYPSQKMKKVDNKVIPLHSFQTNLEQLEPKSKQNSHTPQNLNIYTEEKFKNDNTHDKTIRNKLVKYKSNVETNANNTPNKIIKTLKHNSPSNPKVHEEKYTYLNDVIAAKKMYPIPESLSKKPTNVINQPSSQIMSKQNTKYLKNNNYHNTQKSPTKTKIEPHKYGLNYQNTPTAQSNQEIINKIKINSKKNSLGNNNFGLVKQQNPLSSKLNKMKNKETNLKTSKTTMKDISKKNPFDGKNNQVPTKINDSKLKMSLNDVKTKIDLKPSKNKNIPVKQYDDFLNKPLLSSKHKNDQNFLQPLIKPKINQKTDRRIRTEVVPYSKTLSKYKLSKAPQKEEIHDVEHAPYKVEDLKPITFGKSTDKAMLSKTNPRFDISHPTSRQSFSEDQPNIMENLKLLKPVKIIRPGPEYEDDYDTLKINIGNVNDSNPPEINSSNYSLINGDISDYTEYDINNLKETSTNRKGFGVLPKLKVINGVFKVPLVSHTSFDGNGSAYVSEIFIPIEKSDGQHSVIPLRNLLTGNFQLLNEHDENSSDFGPKPGNNSTLSSSWISIDNTSSSITDQLVDPKSLNALMVANDGNKQMAPIHLIQIINNGLCSGKCNDTNNVPKSQNNRKVNVQKVQNEGKRILSTKQSPSVPNNKYTDRGLENAYNHFDSEILNKFLQVYNPSYIT